MARSDKLAIALVLLVVWMGITMGAAVMQTAGHVSLEALVGERIVIGLVAAPAFLVAAMLWLRWDGLGLATPQPWRSLLILWLPLLYISLVLSGGALIGFPPARTIGFVLFNTIMVGISEELMFRGIMLRGALSSMRIWPAIWLSCILFGLVHVMNVFITGEAVPAMIQAVAAFLSGLFFMAARIRTGSLFPVIAIHALWDFSLFVAIGGQPQASGPKVDPSFWTLTAPMLIVLPMFLYGLFLLRHANRDYADLSDVVADRPTRKAVPE
jgi:membrane protease YdiL (CAAX protease family)